MDVTIESQPRLPADLAITERSRAFYDGRYKWDSDGFTDEHGVYRRFDCYFPEARAPTPLPPMFSNDDQDSAQEEDSAEKQAQALETDKSINSMDEEMLEPDTPCPKRNGIAASTLDNQAPEGTQLFTTHSIDDRERNSRVLQDELSAVSQDELIADCQDEDEDIVASKLESIVTVSKQAGTKPSVNAGYKPSAPSRLESEEAGNFKMPDTPPESPTKSAVEAQTASSISTISTLSPVPSNLSDQDIDIDIEIKGPSMAPGGTASLSNISPKRMLQSKAKAKAKATTRGVAQKVIKGGKKMSGSKSSPLKRKDNNVEDFTLLELHPGEFLRKSGRRKSVRQGKSEGN